MIINQQHITLLRQLVEESADHSIATSNDFIFLSGEMQGRLKETLSSSTLKQLWGYVDGICAPRVSRRLYGTFCYGKQGWTDESEEVLILGSLLAQLI